MKNVLSAVAIIILLAIIFSPLQAHAGLPGTPLPKYVQVPDFCGKTREVTWEARWVPDTKNPKPFRVWVFGDYVKGSLTLTEDHLIVKTRWKGGRQISIPQDIQIKFLTIVSDNDNTIMGDQGYFLEVRDGRVTDHWNRVKCQ